MAISSDWKLLQLSFSLYDSRLSLCHSFVISLCHSVLSHLIIKLVWIWCCLYYEYLLWNWSSIFEWCDLIAHIEKCVLMSSSRVSIWFSVHTALLFSMKSGEMGYDDNKLHNRVVSLIMLRKVFKDSFFAFCTLRLKTFRDFLEDMQELKDICSSLSGEQFQRSTTVVWIYKFLGMLNSM